MYNWRKLVENDACFMQMRQICLFDVKLWCYADFLLKTLLSYGKLAENVALLMANSRKWCNFMQTQITILVMVQ